MFVQDLYLRRANWQVKIYHAVDEMYADEILDDLILLGCRGDDLREAKKHLWQGLPNQGLTYSNPSGKTVMVIGFTSNGAEYWNTLDHERLHLLQHISKFRNIDPYGEEIAYISGEFTREVYNCAKHLLCDCCRHKH